MIFIGASKNTLKFGLGGGDGLMMGFLILMRHLPSLLLLNKPTAYEPPPATKEDSQQKKIRRGDAGSNTKTKPRLGNNDGASKTPLNQISP